MTGPLQVLAGNGAEFARTGGRGVLDAELLRTFVLIVRCGGFTAAGERVGRTQAAVSLQLKRLEDALGVQLIKRSHRAVEPTREGSVLLGYAEQILELSAKAFDAVKGEAGSEVVRLAVAEGCAAHAIQGLVAEFLCGRDDVLIEQSVLPGALVRAPDDSFDVFVGETLCPTSDDQVVSRDELAWFTHPMHAQHLRVPLPVALPPSGPVREAALSALNDRQLPWRLAFVTNSTPGLARSVAAGLAIAPLPRSDVDEAGPGLVPLADPALPPLQVLHRIVAARPHSAGSALALRDFLACRLGGLAAHRQRAA